MHHELKKVDAILCLGSHDIRVAEYATDLFLQGYAPLLIFSGGLGRNTEGVFEEPEADLFAKIALANGVPPAKIIIENKSTNTGENVIFTQKVLKDRDIQIESIIAVQKPYMERRTYATIRKQWPEIEVLVTSPQLSYETYPNETISRDDFINIMLGDLERIAEYPKLSFQIEQEIPPAVWEAHDQLAVQGQG